MPKTKQDILREFDEKWPDKDDNSTTGLFYGCMECGGEEIREQLKSFLSQALDGLAGELVGAVPDPVKANVGCACGSNHDDHSARISGYNCARSALLARCKEMGLEVK